MENINKIDFEGEEPWFLDLLANIAQHYDFGEFVETISKNITINRDLLELCGNKEKILEILLQNKKISSENLDKLGNIFPKAIDKIYLPNKNKNIENTSANNETDIKWRKFLVSLSERIENNLKNHHLMDGFMSNMTGLDFIMYFESGGLITKNNRASIYNLLEEIGRLDLIDFVNGYFSTLEVNSYNTVKMEISPKKLKNNEDKKWEDFLKNLSELLKDDKLEKKINNYAYIYGYGKWQGSIDPHSFLVFCEDMGHIIRFNRESILKLLKDLSREDLIDSVEYYFNPINLKSYICTCANAKKEQEKEDLNQCVICYEPEKKMASIPCGHMLCCKKCQPDIEKKGICPICSKKIERLQEIFT